MFSLFGTSLMGKNILSMSVEKEKDNDTVEMEGGFDADANGDDSWDWENMEFQLGDDDLEQLFKPSSKELKTRDKAVFTAGVLNVVLLVYFSGKYPWIMPYFYTIKFPLLMIIRLYSFCQQNAQYYLLDWCYFANLLVLVFLWSPLRTDPNWFTVVFCIAHGNLPWAVWLFRNSLVFHSLERITSCFIHISPMLVMWCLRWEGHLFEADQRWSVCDPYTGTAVVTRWNVNTTDMPSSVSSLPGCSSILWTLGMPVLCYIGWFLLYGCLMLVLKPDLTKYGTTYTYMTKKGLGKKIRHLPLGWLWYSVINTLFSAGMIAPAVLFLYYEWVNFAFVVLILIIASWNGGSFYVEVFSRKYTASIKKASRSQAS